jgi:hypothetical protein
VSRWVANATAAIVHELKDHPDGMTLDELESVVERYNPSHAASAYAREALQILHKHELAEERDGRWYYVG